jgi:hypothetical protein
MAVNLRCRIITFEGAIKKKLIGELMVHPYVLVTPSSRPKTIQETKMKLALIGAAAVASAAFVTPALAQAVISDPGYCAQFYPNANCQNLGPGNPYTDGGYDRNNNNWQNGNAMMQYHSHHYMHRHDRH